MQTIMHPAARKRAATRRTPLGFLIQPLIRGRTSATKVIDRHFGDTPMGKRLRRAIMHGSLTDGRIKGPRVRHLPGDQVERIPAAVNRDLSSRVARRMLASFLMLVEYMDPESGTAAGVKLWQGNQARRLGLSLRRDRWDRLGGLREVQRYLRIFDHAELLGRSQPNAENVPDHMKARAKLSSFAHGVERLATWAYNKVWTLGGCGLPTALKDTLRRWRGMKVPKRIPRTPEADRGPVTPPPLGLVEWLARRAPGEPPPL